MVGAAPRTTAAGSDQLRRMRGGGVGSEQSTLVHLEGGFSGLSGVLTGLAAMASAIVALIGLSVNQGWIGGHTKSAGSGTTADPTFNPPGPGTFNAVLVVQVDGVTKAQEVPIQATAIL